MKRLVLIAVLSLAGCDPPLETIVGNGYAAGNCLWLVTSEGGVVSRPPGQCGETLFIDEDGNAEPLF